MRSPRLPIFELIAAALLTGAGCSRQPPESPQQTATSPQVEESMPVPDYVESLPHVGGVEGYIGSKACQECHKDEFSTWHRTYHRTMTQVASRESIQAAFDGVVLTNNNIRFTLSQKSDEYWARMERIVQDPNAPQEPAEARIGLVTGSHHMQVFWVAEGHGNLQIGFPFTWLIPEQRWVPRGSTFIRPPDTPQPPEAWNIICSRCHTTGVEPHFDAATRTVETHVGELGISCEACHGPAQRHVELRQAAISSGVESALQEKEIVHPGNLTPERSAQVCGFCHSMKWIDKSENWRAAGFQYRPGDNLEESTPIIRASTVDGIQGLPQYLDRNPDILADFFWNDGMIRVSGREYNGLLDSPCNKGGEFSCLSCHSGHKSEPNDMLAEKGKSNTACLQCHGSYREPQQLAAHTRHAPNSSGSECYNCHMPHTTYGVLKAIRSHQVSSPSVASDLSTGRPNACNLCHLDKTLGWTADYLAQWYQQEKPSLPEHGTNFSHAVRTAIAGDAGQRALIAWHLGWAPALQVSGTNWVAPLLAQLLDDPYAAVRLVAERSMKGAQLGDFIPSGYDYTIAPESRMPVRELIWERWLAGKQTKANDRYVLAEASTVAEQRAVYDALLAWRDHRRVRLRE